MTRIAQRIAFRIILAILFVGVLGTLIAYARGYRFNISQRTLDPTGILVASSFPDGAKIYVNGELSGATNENIVIEPGTYTVEIKKDGYTTWSKEFVIKGEIVVKADALLFPQNPSLSPVTSLGLVKAITSPSKDKVVLISQTGDIEKDGIYVLENSRNPLSTLNQATLIVPMTSLPANVDYALTTIEFSPDEKEIILSVFADSTDKTSESTDNLDEIPDAEKDIDESSQESPSTVLATYLLNLDEVTENPFTITPSVETIRLAWTEQSDLNRKKKIQTFQKPLPNIIDSSFDIISFSPDEEKILYRAKETITLPIIIKPRLPGTNQTEETRTLQKGDIYVYDSTEDKNFHIISTEALEAVPAYSNGDIHDWLFWYIDSAHLVMLRPDEESELKPLTAISISDYDGTNRVNVYTGPFEENFLSITKNGKLLILTNLNARSGELPDVYTVGIR